jgi:hypothetical protein
MISTNSETKSADVRVRLEPELREEAVRILADAGLDLSIAIRLFLKHEEATALLVKTRESCLPNGRTIPQQWRCLCRRETQRLYDAPLSRHNGSIEGGRKSGVAGH